VTAVEVGALDLSNTDLAVLSACETALGKEAAGEGVLGLQRAFQVSGTASVVAGLWKVSDAATVILMERFYDNLWRRKLSKIEALREAQLWMLNSSPKDAELLAKLRRGLALPNDDPRTVLDDDGRLMPDYWAAFVLSGDWH
jgi:CHAT domain-containing protein